MHQTQKQYIVTGGAGFIGSHLIRALLQNECIHITCIDNFDPFYNRQVKLQNLAGLGKKNNFSFLEISLDTVTAASLQKLLPQPVDAIIHLAAKAGVRASIADPAGYQQTNIIGTQTLLDFAVQKKVNKFVFASSSSVYGVNKKMPWKEDELLLPISPYAMTKIAGEGAGHVYSTLYGLSFIALRLFTVYGPAQRPDLAIHRFTNAIINNKPITVFGDGSTSRDYTYVDDIVAGILSAIDYDESIFEIINLGNSHTISLKDLIAALEDITGKKAIINRQPEQPGDVPNTYADISKAKRLLQYNPQTHLQQGLQNFYQWFWQNKELLLVP